MVEDEIETVIVVAHYHYDVYGRLTQIEYVDGAGVAIDNFNYNWTSNPAAGSGSGGMGGLSQLLGASDSRDNSYAYTYDELGQLIGDGVTTWEYDANGNRLDSDTVIGLANQLLEDENWTYEYDAEGNLTDKVSKADDLRWHYGYDHLNHLILAQKFVTVDAVEDLALEAEYKYDAFGNRVEKRVDWDGSGAEEAEVTKFVIDGWKPAKPDLKTPLPTLQFRTGFEILDESPGGRWRSGCAEIAPFGPGGRPRSPIANGV